MDIVRKSGRYFITSVSCPVCDRLKENLRPSIEEKRGGASSLNPTKYPVHNWYTYAQTYSPEFVRYVMQKVGISSEDLIIDPFAGTGTTLVEAKLNGVNSIGMEAIDFLAFVSRVKTKWNIDVDKLSSASEEVYKTAAGGVYKNLRPLENFIRNEPSKISEVKASYLEFLKRGYISVEPLAQLLALEQAILGLTHDEKIKELLTLALAGIIRPSSNMKFGPEIGLRRKYLFSLLLELKQDLQQKQVSGKLKEIFKRHGHVLSEKARVQLINNKEWKILDGEKEYTVKEDSKQLNVYRKKLVKKGDVVGAFQKKVSTIIDDLKKIDKNRSIGKCKIHIGDAREMGSELKKLVSSFEYQRNHIITSPPYPQDHDYTRSVRLELVLLDFAKGTLDFRKLKKRMVRSCTRGVYSTDNDSSYVEKFKEITTLAQEIDKRVKETKGTSGFEKLYSRLVCEYFGGMYRFFTEAYNMLTENGTLTLLVGDSHAFKMTHIETAKLLERLAFDVGFKKSEMEVWRYIRSTAHEFLIPENILILRK